MTPPQARWPKSVAPAQVEAVAALAQAVGMGRLRTPCPPEVAGLGSWWVRMGRSDYPPVARVWAASAVRSGQWCHLEGWVVASAMATILVPGTWPANKRVIPAIRRPQGAMAVTRESPVVCSGDRQSHRCRRVMSRTPDHRSRTGMTAPFLGLQPTHSLQFPSCHRRGYEGDGSGASWLLDLRRHHYRCHTAE